MRPFIIQDKFKNECIQRNLWVALEEEEKRGMLFEIVWPSTHEIEKSLHMKY